MHHLRASPYIPLEVDVASRGFFNPHLIFSLPSGDVINPCKLTNWLAKMLDLE